MRNAALFIIVIMLIGMTMVVPVSVRIENNTREIFHSALAQGITRRDATINYMEALYSSNEGAFYSSLKDWPTDPRVHSHHSVADVSQPLTVLISLNAQSAFDISNCTSFALGLINEPLKVDVFGPVNFSADTPCSAAGARGATELFSQLGILNQLDDDALVSFLRYCQATDGGFGDNIWESPLISNLISTHSALYALNILDSVDSIDTSAAVSYLLSCYSGGGFSYVQDGGAEQSAIPLGLLSLEILDALDSIDSEEVISYVLSEWDNSSGYVTDGTIVDTERAIWSLEILDALDRINLDAVVSWVLSRQSSAYGEFLPFPGGGLEDERLEWTRAAVHILSLINRLDALNEEFTVYMDPVYTVPQDYLDYIAEHVETSTTTTPGSGYIPLPNINWSQFFAGLVPFLIGAVIISPALWWLYSDRHAKRERAEIKKARKPGRR
ncbi:MAG: prenyltransferase/squalene oxidase repeat-containing protein [Candidatus Thorarchaeota archaeon]|nr:prenyltransferase/squalene oxidase repeat-containing protein [Candidatus Thorarchaeota archaeon]